MRIGIDLGGTKIEALLLADDGTELGRNRLSTPAGDYSATIHTIGKLVDGLEQDFGTARSVGVGTPGSISPTNGRMQNANSTCLNGQTLQADIEKHLGRSIRLENDANCLTLSEATDGAAAGHTTVFGIILGTGVGGGLVVNKQLIKGPNALTGEWGHNPLVPSNTAANTSEQFPSPCYCGRQGCIESWISGPAISQDHYQTTGLHMTAQQIFGEKTPESQATTHRFLHRLAMAAGQIINMIDPDCLVFGGGLSNIDCIYTELPKLLPSYSMSARCDTKLVQAKHGDSSGVRGAAWLWP
ncbi:MAG: ROK family protein [Kordiimonadaceae bacterium]|nr:ROK family protein [Kordiimonadaceae bacterium]